MRFDGHARRSFEGACCQLSTARRKVGSDGVQILAAFLVVPLLSVPVVRLALRAVIHSIRMKAAILSKQA